MIKELYEGRTTRLNFFVATLAFRFSSFYAIGLFAFFVTVNSIPSHDARTLEAINNTTSTADSVFNIIGIVLLLVFIFFLFLYSIFLVKRCHDIGLSGWWGLFFYIVPLTIWYLTLKAGDIGDNKYGKDPKQKHKFTHELWHAECDKCKNTFEFYKNINESTLVRCPYCGNEEII